MNMAELWMPLLKVFIVLFIAGTLFDMGLKLDPSDALRGLRDVRFVAYTLLWGFVLIPALAVAVARIIPMDPDYSTGLILLGMAPCAPMLPMIVGKAKGDLGYTAAFMILASVGTVFFMPFAIPFIVEGLSVTAWMIAKPLIVVILIPLVLGVMILRKSSRIAAAMQPWVKRIIGLSTVGIIVLSVIIYGKEVAGVMGSMAVPAQLVFFILSASLTYVLGFGLKYDQKIVLSTGMTTRNVGAALAPLLTVTQGNQQATLMVAMGLPMMIIVSVLTTLFFGRRAIFTRDQVQQAESQVSLNEH